MSAARPPVYGLLAEFDKPEDLLQAANVMTTYADLRIGLADALNVVLADTYRTALMLTLDERHFRVVRPLRGRSAFMLVPLDVAPAS